MEGLFRELKDIDVDDYRIRKINHNDASDIYCIYGDQEVMKYDIQNLLYSIEDAESNVELIERAIKNKWFIRVGLADKKTNELIGIIALHHIEIENRKSQIGYSLKKSYWRKGLMGKALKSFVEYLTNNTNMESLEASINMDNIASIKLAEKLGFSFKRKSDDEMIILGMELK